MSWVWLVSAILMEVAATLCLRASDGYRKKRWLVPVAVGYTAAFTCLSFTLGEGMPVGVAYGIWTALGVVLVALLARAIWKDPLTKRMLLGITLIVIGVLLIEAR